MSDYRPSYRYSQILNLIQFCACVPYASQCCTVYTGINGICLGEYRGIPVRQPAIVILNAYLSVIRYCTVS